MSVVKGLAGWWLAHDCGFAGRTEGRRASNVLRWLTALLLAVSAFSLPTAAQGDPGDVGSVGPSHSGTGTPTGTKRAESVLWFNDGYWWGNLWDTGSSDFHIFRYEAESMQWVDTGVPTDPRTNTHHDVLWDGSTLYVASHQFVADGVAAAPGFPSTLRRYGYDTSSNTYTLLGSSQINNYKTETLVVDKDTEGQLWATWQQGDRIYLNNTGPDGATWGTPFPLPGGDVTPDDISALIAFGPGKMGVMWSKGSDSTPAASDGFYWSVRADGASRDSWSAPAPVVTGAREGDDHMSLKWLDASRGRIFAAVKTNFTSAAQPQLQLLAMDTAGSWTTTTIATVAECPNRVILLIDEGAQRLRTFATYPKPSGTTNAGTCTSSGGAIYEKSTPLDNISFTTDKTPRIVDADQYVHNVSSTKQNLNNARTDGASTTNSGLMVVADVNATSTYWYYFEPGTASPPPDTVAPETSIPSGPVISDQFVISHPAPPPPPPPAPVYSDVTGTVTKKAISNGVKFRFKTAPIPAGTLAGKQLRWVIKYDGRTKRITQGPSKVDALPLRFDSGRHIVKVFRNGTRVSTVTVRN